MIGLWHYGRVALLALAGLGFALTARSELTEWFSENAETFSENPGEKWSYPPGVAVAADGKIEINDGELVYTPAAVAGGDYIVGEHHVAFGNAAMDCDEAVSDAVGIQVVESGDSEVFAVVTATADGYRWTPTAVAAEIKTNYVIRIEQDYTAGGRMIRYSFRKPEETNFKSIATVSISSAVRAPTKVVHEGLGTLTNLTARYASEDPDPYNHWANCGGLLTWAGYGGSDSTQDAFSDKAVYKEWQKVGETWQDGVAWTGKAAFVQHPQMALRFVKSASTVPFKVGCNTNLFDLAGLLVEDNATSFQIRQLNSPANMITRLGDQSGGVSWFVINETFYIYRMTGAATFYGDVNLDIASGASFQLNVSGSYPTKLDPDTHTRLRFLGAGSLRVKTLDATGSVTLDYSGITSGSGEDVLKGKLIIDDSTSFVLPSTLKPGATFKLCSSTITGGGTTVRSVTIGDCTYSAVVTIDGDKRTLSYQLQGYSRFAANPGVFTWTGGSDRFANGTFRRFDCATGTDADETYLGNQSYSNVPGWENVPVNRFWWVFADEYVTNSMLPFAKDAGYVLRFVGNQGASGILQLPQSAMAFGSLVVEGGACGYGFAAGGSADRVRVGADSVSVTNRLEVGESFTIKDASLQLLGKVAVKIAADRQLKFEGTGCGLAPAVNGENRPEISFSGDGTLAGGLLQATGAYTLDFSQLSTARTSPFIAGALTLSPQARLVFPEALSENVAYQPCGGALTATDGIYAVAKGDGEFFLANLVFDASAKTVKYSAVTAYDAATLSAGSTTWSAVASGFTSGRPVQLTLKGDVTLTMDTTGVTIPALLVLGSGRLSIVNYRTPTIACAFCGRNASLERVYNADSADFGKALTVASAAYDTVIQGSDKSSAAVTWSGALSVTGRLATRGYLQFAAEDDSTDQVTFGSDSVLTVESGSLQYAPAADLSGVTFNLNGEWSIGAAAWKPGMGAAVNLRAGGRLAGYGGSSGTPIAADNPFVVKVPKGVTEATLGVRINASVPVACQVGAGAKLTLEAEMVAADETTGLATYGSGAIKLNDSAVDFVSWTFAGGGLYGSGTAGFFGNPLATGVGASLTDSSRWSGTAHFQGAEFADFDPDELGNANSVVKLEMCNGYFARNLTASTTTVELAATDSTADYAFYADNGYDGNIVALNKIKGEGRLCVGLGGSERYQLYLPSLRNFTGSLEVAGVGNRSAIVLGATDSQERSAIAESDRYDGTILVYNGEVTMNLSSSWSAVSGIYIREGATLADGGRLISPVIGSGTLKYTGELRSWQPETAANLVDGEHWKGTVLLDSMTVYGANLALCGNGNSKVALQGVTGWLQPTTVESEVTLLNGGLTVTMAKELNEVTFNSLTGTGSLTFDADIAASGWTYRLKEVNDYSGSLRLNSEQGSVLIGNAERTLNGALEVESGYYLKSKRDWSVPKAVFGAELTVEGEVGDALLQVDGGNVDFEEIALTLVNGDPRRNYQLKYDADSKSIVIVAAATPPTATVDEVIVRYGADMTNAFVAVDVSDYWSGYDFDGRTLAEVYVYDVNGKVVGYRSAVITGTGTNEIGFVDLPYGRGRDYRYEVRISTDGSSSFGEFIDALAAEETGVRLDRRWIHEDAESYQAISRSRKTGDWLVGSDATVSVAEGAIDITSSGKDGGRITFRPDRETTNEVVKVEHRVRFRGAFDEGAVPKTDNLENQLAAITLVQLPGVDEELAYGGWVADDSLEDGGYYATLFAREAPVIGEEIDLGWTVNYTTGYLVYSANGVVLTNADGISHFPVSSVRKLKGNRLRYRGTAVIDEVTGTEWNRNLARVASADGTLTNQYETVDQAVAAAVAGGVTNVTLLWDATWRPTAEDLGRTIVFESAPEAGETYRLTVDGAAVAQLERGGYRVVDNGGGSYTIDVISHQIDFDPNGGIGDMQPQKYSITNMVFNLAPNEFEFTAKDFAGWNLMADGSGATNWADGAEIDMSEFGLTNLTLYAQWTTAVRTIVIEPADEFVYVESVYTNGARHAGVRYFGTDLTAGRGQAIFPLTHGSDLVVNYSTDLEKSLTFDFLQHRLDWTGSVIAYDEQPKLSGEPMTGLQLWAARNCIAGNALSLSPYSTASWRLKLNTLLQETSEVRISEFAVTETGCSFKVTVDGYPLSSAAEIAPMIRVAADLNGGWSAPSADAVSMSEDGTVSVRTVEGASFIKIVIPKN